jgi:hypothetical protein
MNYDFSRSKDVHNFIVESDEKDFYRLTQFIINLDYNEVQCTSIQSQKYFAYNDYQNHGNIVG